MIPNVPKYYKNDVRWFKMILNDLNDPELIQSDAKMIQNDPKNDLKLSEIIKNYPKIIQNYPKLS